MAIGSSTALVSCPVEKISPCTCKVTGDPDEQSLIISCNNKGLEEIPLLLPLHDEGCKKYPIQKIDFSNNNITTLDNATMFDGLCLGIDSRVVLSGNKINLITSNVFKSIGSLGYLNLARNHLIASSFDNDAFKELSSLKQLDMSNNPLNSFPSMAFRDMNLTLLELRNCNITTLPGRMFEHWTSSQALILDLQGNEISSTEKDSLSAAKTNMKLSVIKFDSDRIDGYVMTFLEDPCDSDNTSGVIFNPSKWNATDMAEPATHVNLGPNVQCVSCKLASIIRTSMYSISGTCNDGREIEILGDLWTVDDTPYASFHKTVEFQSSCPDYNTDTICNDYADCSNAIPASYHAKCDPKSSASDVTKSIFTLIICIVASLGLVGK